MAEELIYDCIIGAGPGGLLSISDDSTGKCSCSTGWRTDGFKCVVNPSYESSLAGLFIVGPLNTGNDQVVIAAGEGAVAAIEINKRLLELYQGLAQEDN